MCYSYKKSDFNATGYSTYKEAKRTEHIATKWISLHLGKKTCTCLHENCFFVYNFTTVIYYIVITICFLFVFLTNISQFRTHVTLVCNFSFQQFSDVLQDIKKTSCILFALVQNKHIDVTYCWYGVKSGE